MRAAIVAALVAVMLMLGGTASGNPLPSLPDGGILTRVTYTHPVVDPPPPAPQPSSPWAPEWAGPGILEAWGFYSGDWSPTALISKMQQAGFKYLSVEAIPPNDPYVAEVKQAAAAAGITVGIWINVPQASPDEIWREIDLWHPAFFMANVEGPLGWDFPAEFRARYPHLDAALQTNFGGFENPVPATGAEYRQYGFALQHEDYVPDTPNATPQELDFRAWQIGYPAPTSSLIGVYHDVTAASYLPLLAKSGRAHLQWIYLAEESSPADWQTYTENLHG